MVIEGNTRYIPDEEFKTKIQQALDLLKAKGGANYALVTTNAEKIEAHKKSGANVYKSAVQIARPTFDTSLTWLASVLVHESCHIVQHRTKKDFVGKEAEQECNNVQLEALRLIGAPQYEITYLFSQTGEHSDLDQDGKVTNKDYKLRDY